MLSCFHSDAKADDLRTAAFLIDFCGLPCVTLNSRIILFVFFEMFITFERDKI